MMNRRRMISASGGEAPTPTPSYGGIPVFIDNKYFRSNAGLKVSEALDSDDYFLAGPFDTGSTSSKQMTFTRIYATNEAALYLFNDITLASVDYWACWGSSYPQAGTTKTGNSPGQYIITSVLKSRAGDFWIKDANGNYIVKGNNVT